MFNGIYQYNFPTTIRFGDGAVSELPAYLISQGLKAPLIVTDPTVAGLDFFDKIRNDLSRQGIRPETFSGIHKKELQLN